MNVASLSAIDIRSFDAPRILHARLAYVIHSNYANTIGLDLNRQAVP
jgi:ABC-type metal ion transport system substrate-binding protein